jgi:hypothetical protein
MQLNNDVSRSGNNNAGTGISFYTCFPISKFSVL